MEEKKKSKIAIIITVISVIVILTIVATVIFILLNTQKVKLYNSTFELGQENYIEELTKTENVYIKDGYTFSIKDNKIDINNVGIYEVTFEIKGKGETSQEIKKIQIKDTTPPTVELKKDTFYIGDNINIEEIVTIKDLSQKEEIAYNDAKAQVEGQFDTSKEGESTVKISVTDKNGNTGTQEIKITVKNPIISVYDYIQQAINKDNSRYKSGSYDNKFVLKYTYNFSNGLENVGWINFTDKVQYDYTKMKSTFGTITSASLSYFENDNIVREVYSTSGYVTGNLAVDSYLNNKPNGFNKATGDLSTYQNIHNNEMSSINRLLNNNDNKINLNGKTEDQLKNETVDLRELQ